ncbi:MAG: MipA/OmpV family protein [Bordetella sp.]|nr:MipA/OmpV family protein [Bordetella sp.]
MYERIGLRAALGLALGAAATLAHAEGNNFIGLGVGVVPVYEGSSKYHAVPLPLINYQSGAFFISPRAGLPALGLRTRLATDLEAGVFLGMSLGRDSDDADRTKGMRDIDFHAAYGAYVEWTPGRYSLGAAWRQAAKSGYGGTLELRTSYAVVQSEQQQLRLGVSTQWSNSNAMNTWFGVTRADAARSDEGLSPYTASSGFKSAAAFANWNYRLTKDWSVLSTVGVATVLGDARDSPLNERKTNLFGSVGVTYRF